MSSCPSGAYCPENSAFPTKCPPGTQNLLVRGT